MSVKTATTCLLVAAFLVPVVAYTEDQDSDRSHPGAFVKDSAITTKIKAKLAADQAKSLLHVSVDTDANGAVMLSGRVKTDRDANRAMALARETDGVTSVKSTIEVRKDD